jgi:ATP-dependent helicase IRC3
MVSALLTSASAYAYFDPVDEPTDSLEQRAEEALAKDLDLGTGPDTVNEIPEPISVTYIDYDNPFSFAGQSSGAPHIAKISPHAWVGCGNDIYVLECLGKGYIRIEPTQGKGKPLWLWEALE